MTKNPHAVALGRKGGSVTSERKAQTSAANGKLGGRPRKQKPIVVTGGHALSLDETVAKYGVTPAEAKRVKRLLKA